MAEDCTDLDWPDGYDSSDDELDNYLPMPGGFALMFPPMPPGPVYDLEMTDEEIMRWLGISSRFDS